MLTVYKNATIKLENVTGAAQATAAKRGKKEMNVIIEYQIVTILKVNLFYFQHRLRPASL